MALSLVFEPKLVEFSPEDRDAWVAGERSGCRDRYCAGISGGQGIGGFGEYTVGRYWQDQGYEWVHHDFDIIGANKRVYESQGALEDALGSDRLREFKAICQSLWPFAEEHHGPVEQPDLMIYKGTSEIRFAECKRYGTPDQVNPRQALGLFLISSLLKVPVDVFIVAEKGTCSEPLKPITFVYDEHGVRVAR